MDTIDAIDIIDDIDKIAGTKGIDGIEGKDESVGREGRCYHSLRSYADSMLNRKMGLLLNDGIERIDAMKGLMMAMLSLA